MLPGAQQDLGVLRRPHPGVLGLHQRLLTDPAWATGPHGPTLCFGRAGRAREEKEDKKRMFRWNFEIRRDLTKTF